MEIYPLKWLAKKPKEQSQNPKSKAINSLFNKCIDAKDFKLTTQIVSLLYVTLVGPTVEQLRLALSSLHTLYVNSNRFYFYLSFSSKACLGIPELKKLVKHFWDSLFLTVGPVAA